jgi:hypothetical protein
MAMFTVATVKPTHLVQLGSVIKDPLFGERRKWHFFTPADQKKNNPAAHAQ